MKIIVCIKRVPDTEARVRIAPDGKSIDSSGIKYIINPYDEFALEAGLQHRDVPETGEVVALAVGAADSAETLRAALAMGADAATLLETSDAPEGLAVARAIAAELGSRPFDLALFGVRAIDDDLNAVGAMVAELLDLPSATAVAEFSIENGKVVADREIEGGTEVVELALPCVLTITKGAYEPRYASLKGIMAAKKKPLDQKAAEPGDPGIQTRVIQTPPTRQPGRIIGEGPDAVPELLRLLREEAKVL